jgi:threonine dehydrogenase-like Zn-dependent dehydrogenase
VRDELRACANTEHIIRPGRHHARTDLGNESDATDIVSAHGEERIAQVRELTGGHGTHVVLEAVGTMPAYSCRPGAPANTPDMPDKIT